MAVPPDGHPTKEIQFLFVNGRPVGRRCELHRLVATAAARLARALAPPAAAAAAERQPASQPAAVAHGAFVLFLSLDADA